MAARAAGDRGPGDGPRRRRPGAGAPIRGQVAVATTPGRVRRVRCCPPARRPARRRVAAVAAADLVLLGPGSWFTSVLPHLLVPDLRDALVADRGPPGRRAEPGAAAGRDRRLLPAAAPGGSGGARSGPAGGRRARGRRRGAGPPWSASAARAALGAGLGAGSGRRPATATPRHDPARLRRVASRGRRSAEYRLSSERRRRRDEHGRSGAREERGTRSGDDGDGEGRAEPARGDQDRADRQGGGLRAAAVRRRAAHRGRPGRRRGRAGHRLGGAPAAPRHQRGLRPRQRGAACSPAAACAAARATSSGSSSDGEGLARQTGLLDQRGRPVRGLPPPVVSGGICDAEAAWRGAFLAHGSLTEPGRSSSLEVTCPGPEAALALVGAARRLGIPPRPARCAAPTGWWSGTATRSARCSPGMGAHERVLAWEERRMRREVRATANRLANFDDANLRRSARAAVAAGARVDAGAGDPRRRRCPSTCWPPAGCGWSTSRPRWRSSASSPTRR